MSKILCVEGPLLALQATEAGTGECPWLPDAVARGAEAPSPGQPTGLISNRKGCLVPSQIGMQSLRLGGSRRSNETRSLVSRVANS